MTVEKIKSYIDLTRIQFFFVWPLLFLSGLFLSFLRYGNFDWLLVGKRLPSLSSDSKRDSS